MIRTFPKGGIHPSDNKLSASSEIQKLPLPKTATIMVAQHIGAPADIIIKVKDKVKAGQIIGQAHGLISANIHSPVSGVVTKIDNVTDASGYKHTAIIIRVKDDEWEEGINRDDTLLKEIKHSAPEIKDKIIAAGIVGLGGAAFPSHVKLSPPKDKKIEILIINGVECEPYLTADDRLMLERGEEIIVGIDILMKALDVKKAAIGIEANTKAAEIHLKHLLRDRTDISIYTLMVKYPQGGEKQLIKAVTGREVPSGGLPADVGAVVHNVGTVFAVYQAVQKNKPLIERVVTVTGKELAKPSNFLVRIGTPVSDLIEAAGGLPQNTGKIINGGPMMGKALKDGNAPITKGTSGILLLDNEESRRRKAQNCIRCSRCSGVCPMGLEPYLLMALTEKQLFKRLMSEDVLDCIECGSCSYVCPSSRPLLDYIRLGKKIAREVS